MTSIHLRHAFQPGLWAALCVALSAAVAPVNAADGPGSARHQMPAQQMLKAYRNECSACHMAYPPGFLPKSAWTHIMQGLDKHYGSDASLDAPTVAAISEWLQAQEGSDKRVTQAPATHRISESDWFIRKHREMNPATWQRAAIKSRSNCVACHTQAEKGNFDEDAVRIPR
jgi:mono/diheme cytochrome c family protein